MMSRRLWIKQPLACFDGTRQIETNGLVIEDGKIVELLAVGQQPSPSARQFSMRVSTWSYQD